MPEPVIVNVVSTADLEQVVDLVKVSQLPYTIFNQKKYGGRVAYLKTPSMNGKVSIFSSGKLISVGTKSSEQAQLDLKNAVKILVSEGLINPVNIVVKLRNIVAVHNLGIPVDLEEMALIVNGIYEPEQFPGLILRQDEPKVTYLVFTSGKIVMAGIKSLEDLDLAASKIKEIIDDL